MNLLDYIIINGLPATKCDLNDPQIKRLCWFWTGSTRSVGGVDVPHTAKGNPARLLYKQLIGDVPPRHQLRRDPSAATDDVNPYNYKLIRVQSPFEYNDMDAAIGIDTLAPPSAIAFGEPAAEEHMSDLVAVLNEVYEATPFSTWDDYAAIMAETFAGELPRNQHEALNRAGILTRLTGEPRYVS